jgi:uncharacterized protein YkwD
VRAGAGRARVGFRILLGVTLVWSAWPTVAGAMDREGDPPSASVAASTPRAPAADPVTSSTTSTSLVAPSTDLPSPASTASAPSARPVTAPPVATAAAPVPPPDPSTSAAPAPPPATDAGPAAAAAPSVCDGAGGDVLAAMNRDRAATRVPPLCADAQLDAIAQAWADHLAQTATFVHQDLWRVVPTTPFRALAENILRSTGVITTDQMEQAWMNSPEHRANILNPPYIAAGVGIARRADGATYAVVDFGGDLP